MTAPESYSIILALLTALAAGLVGSLALMKRMSLAGDVVAHIALPGLGLALLFHINPLIGAAAALLLGTFLIWHLQKGETVSTDVAIGVIFTAALAVGTLVTPSEDLIEALFGGFQSLTLPWFLLGIFSVLVIVLFIHTFRHKLILTLFSPELAAATGVSVSRVNLYFLLVFSLRCFWVLGSWVPCWWARSSSFPRQSDGSGRIASQHFYSRHLSRALYQS